MSLQLKVFSVSLLSMLLGAGIARSAAICANGTPELGNCSAPGTLASGGSISGTYSFTYQFGNGDDYLVTTTYSATDSNGTSANMSFSSNAVYTGNNGNTHAASMGGDTLTDDFLENFTYTGSSMVTGATSTATLVETSNPPGSYVEAQLLFDNQSIGVMGPFYGPGAESATAGPTTLTGLSNPVTGDFRFTQYFAPGTAPVPEPATAGFWLLGMAGIAIPAVARRYRRVRA
jgi:hypothetical protein